MKVLYFDCFSGISGDMTLGALIDLGLDKELFLEELKKLNLLGYDLEICKVEKYGINGTDVNVKVNDEYSKMVSKLEEHVFDETTHSHNDHKHDEGHHKGKHHGRNLKDIEEIINLSDLKHKVKDLSIKIFKEIAKAEAKVHNKDLNEVHFHEVGAVDSIVDIVGAAICINMLGVDKIMSSPVHDGQGVINCEHGVLPVPVPAVLEMLSSSNIPYICENIQTELVTPTGIGILKCISDFYGCMPGIMIDKVGYGMGKREIGRLNALRVIMGILPDEASIISEQISMFESTIDDMTPEMLGFTMEKLFACGALDVYYTSIYMKKNRPAIKLTVISNNNKETEILKILFEETTTLGIRKSTVNRVIMEREMMSVDTKYGNIKVKIAKKEGFKKFSPEYEDCKMAAYKYKEPLWKIYFEVNKNIGDYEYIPDA